MRWVPRLFKLFLLLLLVGVAGYYAIMYSDSRLTGKRSPYFQQQTDNSIIIRWQTEKPVMGFVRFGKDPESLKQIKLDKSARKIHSLKLTRLQPDTRYYYKVGGIDGRVKGKYKNGWFHTSPVPGTPVPTRIWVIGDSGQPGKTAIQVRDAMLKWSAKHPLEGNKYIDVWLMLGDNAYRSGSNDQYQAGLFDTYPNILSNTTLWPVYGNHDARRWIYFRLFDLPENGEAGGVPSGTEHYYSFDYGDVHFIMLDSQDSSTRPGSVMLNWLQRDLAHNQRKWVIAAFHHPPYTKGSHDSDNIYDSGGRMVAMREHVLPILEAGSVDLVLSGHSHVYERSYLLDCLYQDSSHFSRKNIVSRGVYDNNRDYLKPLAKAPHQGTVYIVDGSSSKVGHGKLNHPANVVGLAEAGSVLIDIEGNTLTSRFINNKEVVADSFSITKRAGYKSGYHGCMGRQ